MRENLVSLTFQACHICSYLNPLLNNIVERLIWKIPKAFVERLIGENPIGELLSRLEVLIMEESRRIVAQTFEVITHLITDTRVVTGGVYQLFTRLRRC